MTLQTFQIPRTSLCRRGKETAITKCVQQVNEISFLYFFFYVVECANAQYQMSRFCPIQTSSFTFQISAWTPGLRLTISAAIPYFTPTNVLLLRSPGVEKLIKTTSDSATLLPPPPTGVSCSTIHTQNTSSLNFITGRSI